MKRNEIVTYALSCVGKSRDQVGCSGTHAWCANFVSNVLRYVGIANMYDLSCTYLQGKMSESSEWSEPDEKPIPGDIIFFDWDHISEERPLDHVGIVISMSGNTVTYVNGNGNSSTHVTKQSIEINNSCIAYWMRYIADETNSVTQEQVADTSSDKTFTRTLRQLKKGCKGADVKSLQQLLFAKGYSVGNCGDDGDFGEATEKAVMNYQTDCKITSDGIVGEQTFKNLWGY